MRGGTPLALGQHTPTTESALWSSATCFVAILTRMASIQDGIVYLSLGIDLWADDDKSARWSGSCQFADDQPFEHGPEFDDANEAVMWWRERGARRICIRLDDRETLWAGDGPPPQETPAMSVFNPDDSRGRPEGRGRQSVRRNRLRGSRKKPRKRGLRSKKVGYSRGDATTSTSFLALAVPSPRPSAPVTIMAAAAMLQDVAARLMSEALEERGGSTPRGAAVGGSHQVGRRELVEVIADGQSLVRVGEDESRHVVTTRDTSRSGRSTGVRDAKEVLGSRGTRLAVVGVGLGT
jgi:hypothetical protein